MDWAPFLPAWVPGLFRRRLPALQRGRRIQFALPGKPPEKTHGKMVHWSIPKNRVDGTARYASFHPKGHGFFREIGDAYPVVKMVGIGADGKRVETVLLDANRVFNDERAHFVVAKLKTPMVPESIQVQLVTADSSAQFSLSDLMLYGDIPAIDAAGCWYPLRPNWPRVTILYRLI